MDGALHAEALPTACELLLLACIARMTWMYPRCGLPLYTDMFQCTVMRLCLAKHVALEHIEPLGALRERQDGAVRPKARLRMVLKRLRITLTNLLAVV